MSVCIKKIQFGKSMLEMMGVLAIVGILSVLSIVSYNVVMKKYRTNALIDKIELIVQQTRVLFDGNYTDENIGKELVDAEMIADVANPFGGNLTVSKGEADSEFTIATTNTIPLDVCAKLLSRDWNVEGMFVKIATLTNSVGFGTKEGMIHNPSVSDIASSCADNEKIIWTFR